MCPLLSGTDRGAAVVSLTSDSAAVMPKPKHTMLPVLVVLFLISYGLMCLLVVEQGSTIDSQRFLIRQLLGDSTQLSAMKGKEFPKQRAEAQARAQANAHSQAQNPSSPQPTPQDRARNDRNAGKVRRPAPLRPPKDASDTVDERRALISI
jgi:hypothetical protein